MKSEKIPGSLLRKLRFSIGIKQEDAAKRLGITQQAYSKLENSEAVKEKTISKILKAFDIEEEDFKKLAPPHAAATSKRG